MESLTDRLDYLLEKNRISRYVLSKKTGISEATLSRIMLHNVKPNIATLEKIADYFHVSEQWLLTGNDTGSFEPNIIYDVITYDDLDQGSQTDYLNQKSYEGWQLVSATYMIDKDGARCTRFYFKKEVRK